MLRRAVLGWLMQCARSQPQVANTRLAVLYDLLLFQPQVRSTAPSYATLTLFFFSPVGLGFWLSLSAVSGFSPKQTDSIMNIEPAMLLMVHSIPRYPSMTNTLLEFLIMAKDHYNPARRALTHRSFEKGISALVQRGVVRPSNSDFLPQNYPRLHASLALSSPLTPLPSYIYLFSISLHLSRDAMQCAGPLAGPHHQGRATISGAARPYGSHFHASLFW
jgi:ABC-type sugar transport system permease subunit